MTEEILDDEQHERANTQSVRDFRWRQRGTTAERQAKAIYLKSNRGCLERQWAKQWSRISDDEKAAILAQHKIAIDALNEITKVVDGLSTGRQPGIDLPFPDFIYRDCQAVPRCACFHNTDVAASVDEDDFNSFDDVPWKLYGRITKVSQVLWSEFCRLVLVWARANPGDCDEAVQAELESLVTSNIYTPVSAPMPGIRQSSRSEELSMQREKQHAELHRRIAEGRRL